jgi:hypothetical protein
MPNERTIAPGILREAPVGPRKLGHVVIGTPDAEATQGGRELVSPVGVFGSVTFLEAA